MSSAFLQTSVYHWAKSTSRAVMASTCLLSCAIVSIPLLYYIIMYRAGRFSLNSYCIHSDPDCQLSMYIPFVFHAFALSKLPAADGHMRLLLKRRR